MKIKRFFFASLTLILSSAANLLMSQDQNMVFFNFVEKMPLKLLSSNTAILYSRMPIGGATISEDGPTDVELLQKFHAELKGMGVNGVVYIIQDVRSASNIAVKMQTFDTLKVLKVENIIIYTFSPYLRSDGKMMFIYTFQVTAFNGTQSLYNNDQDACKLSEYDFDKTMKQFSKIIGKSNLSKKTMAISEKPSMVEFSGIPKGEKFTFFPPDLKSSKLLFYQYEEIGLPQKKPDGMMMKLSYKVIESNNKHVPENNAKLEKMISASKLNYELIKMSTDCRKKEGACYVVMPMFLFNTEEKTKFSNEYRWVTDPSTDRNDYKNTGTKAKTIQTSITYTYYYITNTKTGNVYFVDYGDYQDPNKSLEAFLKKINNSTVK